MKPAATFYELFANNLRDRPDKVFLIDPDRQATYAEVDEDARRFAAQLGQRGVGPGDRVIVQLRKGMDEVVAMLGTSMIGAVMVNVNVVCTAEQIGFILADCAASAIVVGPAMAKALTGQGVSPAVLLTPDDIRRSDGMAGTDPRLPTDLAAIIYTSGSTGKPKGVMLSHRNILVGAESVATYLNLRENDRLLSVLPYSFDYGLNQLTTMMLVGGTIVHQPVAMATEIVRDLQKHGVTGLAAVPPLWIQLVRLLEAAPAAFPHLRYITNSGGKIPTSTLKRMPEVFPGTDVVLMYGLTEAFRSTYLPPDRFAEKMGSIGRAIPNAEIYVIKKDGGIAGPGERGELVHRGPLVSQGYWGRPEATAEKIRPCPALQPLIGDEPVVFSGDIVRVDEDGDLWFVGRNDALIKTSGFRVSPEDVEDSVYRSELVADAIAFGVEDDLLGQSVHIAVTLLPGATREALMAYCRRQMPSYMIPRAIHVWAAAMPRTGSGKLDRPSVIQRCETGMEALPQISRLSRSKADGTGRSQLDANYP